MGAVAGLHHRIEAVARRLGNRHEDGVRRESPELQGLGIGLTIVREAVRALGGEVEIGPRASGGTTARVVLPAADAPAP